MPTAEILPPPKPVLAFRVGVTGSRFLSPEAVAGLRQSVRSVLSRVRDAIEAVGTEPTSSRYYQQMDGFPKKPLLRLLSPLAEGADRLVAEEALELGFRLEVILPFRQEEYEKDFDADSRTAFRKLLAKSGDAGLGPSIVTLDGARGLYENRSYEAAGRMVVRNCDLLIAIWDGQPGKGRGGTAEIVHFASNKGPPVWWIDSNAKLPDRWLYRRLATGVTSRAEVDQAEPSPGPEPNETAPNLLNRYLRSSLEPPPMSYHLPRCSLGHFDAWLGHLFSGRVESLARYFAERNANAPFWAGLHRWVMDLAAWNYPAHGITEEHDRQPGAQSTPSEGPWAKAYQAADLLSTKYADCYRSSYVLVFAFAAFALLCAVIVLEEDRLLGVFTAVELAVLGGIVWFVMRSDGQGWHDRWISYRLLAELCRKQQILSLIGFSLPAVAASRVVARGAHRSSWLAWYFNAFLRAGSLPAGDLIGTQLDSIKDEAQSTLLAGQIQYHEERHARCEHAAKHLAHLAEAAFGITLVCIVAKLVIYFFWGHVLVVSVLGFIAILAPGISAAFFGIRAYAELELLADQSERMKEVLLGSQRRLDDLSLTIPLASQDLAAEMLSLSTQMLTDVDGWAQLFQHKSVELS